MLWSPVACRQDKGQTGTSPKLILLTIELSSHGRVNREGEVEVDEGRPIM